MQIGLRSTNLVGSFAVYQISVNFVQVLNSRMLIQSCGKVLTEAQSEQQIAGLMVHEFFSPLHLVLLELKLRLQSTAVPWVPYVLSPK